ncbi:hypothetical protein CLIB1423_09S01640 [[Candida] railenensis]|uniref:Uncharacterized protein n=1 Tax=[Candida] railenensis TaxID=45579 RepID=A0A9P0VZ09_9ASCO|nr:hypothetical protein CLIB1423_09S01640 [[Candida] railenensis]
MSFTRSFVESEKELDSIIRSDIERKSLIKLAVVQAINTCQKYKQNITKDRVAEETVDHKSSHDYDLIISKLKQEHATKEKIYESKIEALNEEIEKLKDSTFSEPSSQISRPSSAGLSSTSTSRPGLSFSTSPYLNKLSSTSRNYLSPTINSLSKSIASVPSPDDHLGSTILSPIQAKKKVSMHQQANPKPKRTYTNFNTLKRMNPGGPSIDDIIKGRVLKQLNVPNARRAHVIQNNPSNASEPPTTTVITATSVTTTRSEPGTPSKPSTNQNEAETENGLESANIGSSFDESQGPFSAATSMATSDDDFYASANSTLNNLEVGQQNKDDSSSKKRTKKKVQLSKSGARKLSHADGQQLGTPEAGNSSLVKQEPGIGGENSLFSKNDTSPNKGLNLEDEDLNTLNYYQDSNWTEENDSTPKRGASRMGSDGGGQKKRRRIIFKID